MEIDNKFTPDQIADLEAKELEALLQAELQKQTDSIDTSLVQLLVKELVSRGKDPKFEDNTAVEQACEKFRQQTKSTQKIKPRWYQSWITKVASVVIALGILLFALPDIAQAGTIPDILTQWSDSLFRFFTPGATPDSTGDYEFQTSNSGLQQIYDAVTQMGITTPVVPMWIPEGFELCELDVFDFSDDRALYAALKQRDKYIYFSVVVHNGEANFQHEKDTQNVTVFEIADIKYYMISNNEEFIVTWWTNGVECSIATDCQEDEIQKLLFSIYIPED